jgi:hypothetical protein
MSVLSCAKRTYVENSEIVDLDDDDEDDSEIDTDSEWTASPTSKMQRNDDADPKLQYELEICIARVLAHLADTRKSLRPRSWASLFAFVQMHTTLQSECSTGAMLAYLCQIGAIGVRDDSLVCVAPIERAAEIVGAHRQRTVMCCVPSAWRGGERCCNDNTTDEFAEIADRALAALFAHRIDEPVDYEVFQRHLTPVCTVDKLVPTELVVQTLQARGVVVPLNGEAIRLRMPPRCIQWN